MVLYSIIKIIKGLKMVHYDVATLGKLAREYYAAVDRLNNAESGSAEYQKASAKFKKALPKVHSYVKGYVNQVLRQNEKLAELGEYQQFELLMAQLATLGATISDSCK